MSPWRLAMATMKRMDMSHITKRWGRRGEDEDRGVVG